MSVASALRCRRESLIVAISEKERVEEMRAGGEPSDYCISARRFSRVNKLTAISICIFMTGFGIYINAGRGGRAADNLSVLKKSNKQL